MSLPLTRRIARAALLIAAGAAPVVGAAGTAGAATLPQAPDLGGLTTVDGAGLGEVTDGAGLGKAVDGASRQGAETANETGGKLVGTALPVASRTVGEAGTQAAPTVQKAAGGLAGNAGETLGGAAEGGLPLG
ncbi:ATP-binding protein [Streptomyces sp. ML-6]|uniref:ATP-binding protein n=1 Tax=Streptomyces sp. ML-6 TaxID=2982693 RepID=UPI0024BFD7D3|nr:ATP-binding protein [Streptomyces sp. ML-6]MDK0522011.1 ATP-binding protein [Streptomyces sp. ML-6]